jgi:hypothetical protein
MKTKFIVAVTTLLSVSVINVSAQNNKGLHDESQRIHQGVASGQLTAMEAAKLNNQKARLKEEAFRYKANDGRIDRRERADLRRDNKRFSENICRQKHDSNRRYRG